MSGGDKLDFEIRPNPAPVSAADRAALLANPGFGRVFTDHMVTIRYADGKGWYDARVEARAPIPMDPASAVLHYAQEIFEGLKAYRTADGGVTMFRPDANAARFAASAAADGDAGAAATSCSSSRCASWSRSTRTGSPTDEDAASTCGRSCSPARSSSACARPTSTSTWSSPRRPGAYFSGGVKPVTVWVSPDYTRAAPGGTGAAKCGGNYAASLVGAGGGDRGRAATRWSSWTRSSAASSTSWAA